MNYKVGNKNPIHYSTLKECLDTVCLKYSDNLAYRQIINKNEDIAITYGMFYKRVIALGTRLLTLGLKGSKIALIGENSIHWIEGYMATVCGVGVAVPIDKELDVETMAYQVDFADCEAVFLSAKEIKKLPVLREKCPDVRYWIIMRSDMAKEIPDGVLKMEDLLEEGEVLPVEEKVKFLSAEVHPYDLCDIIFTSGTTGVNKGVMLSHRNVTTVVSGALSHIWVGRETLTCLPVNHVYEKNCNVLVVFTLGKLLVINDDLMHLSGNLRKYGPNISTMVPMLLETLERRIWSELKKHGMNNRVKNGIRVSNLLRKVGIDRRNKIFHPILALMGENLEQIVVGGAPLKEETRRFFDNFGIAVVNGYGISECGPLVAANYSCYQKPGSVGNVIPHCEVKIVNPNENGDGTIFVRGDNVMMGYYKDDESTKRVLSEDGWLDTGDLGHLDSDGFLYLSGRVKNLIILSNGKNVSPEELEEKLYQKMPYVLEAVVFADEKETGIYAMVYLDKAYLAEHPVADIEKQLANDLTKFNQGLPSYKRIVDISISETEFAKTTTKKIQRYKVRKVINKV